MKRLSVNVDWDSSGQALKHTWKGLLNIDQFRWFVRRDVQDQLRLAHDEIGGRHVRAVGMFDDELRVIGADPTSFRTRDRKPHVNFQILDYVIDSLLDVGVKPMFTTCFTPSVMASGDRRVFTTGARVSPPKDLAAWASLVRDSARHMVDRYGRAEVASWYFEVWNEPNLNGFFDGTQEQFFALWKATYHALKDVDPGFRVGGPSTARAEWIAEMIEWGRRNACEPDYVIAHVYNNDSESQPLSPFDGPQEERQSRSPHFSRGVIRGTRRTLNQLNFRGELHWNEWGRSWWPCFPARETASEAAFIVKTMAEVSQDADLFGYWCLSDVYDQVGYGAQAFHGNYGMLNLNGLRKPNYHAHQLLCRLGDRRHDAAGEGLDDLSGAIATSRGKSRQVLVYHYDHNEGPGPGAQVRVNLPAGANANVRLYRLMPGENDVVARWREMGEPAYPTREQVAALRDTNQLQEAGAGSVAIADGIASFSLAGSGVGLLEIDG